MRLFIITFLIGIVAVLIIGFSWFDLNDKESLNDFKKYAEFLTNKHEYEKAIYYYDQILLNEPRSLQILLSKANALMSLNQFENAIEVFDKVLKLDPNNDSAANGKTLATQKMSTHSIKPVSTFNKYDTVGNPDLELYLDSEYSEKINRETSILYSEPKYLETLSTYDYALLNDPSNLSALNGKAETLLSLKQYDDAIALYENILLIYPDDLNALNGKAYAYYLKATVMELPGIFYDSVHGYEKTLEIDPRNLNALVGIATALASLERYDESVDYYMVALSVDADHKNAKNGLFSLWIKLGNGEAKYFNFDSAIEYFDKVLEKDPKNLDALLAKASAYTEWGKSKEKYYSISENMYVSILENYPNNTRALNGFGYVLSEQLEFEKALFYYNQSLAIDPENINAQAGKSFVLKRMN